NRRTQHRAKPVHQLLTGGLDDERIVRREHYAWKVGVERITGAWIERLITQPRSISVFGARRGLRDAETRRGEKGGRGAGEKGRRRDAGRGDAETRRRNRRGAKGEASSGDDKGCRMRPGHVSCGILVREGDRVKRPLRR